MLSDNEVRLHLSGHLHLQHYMEEDDVAEVVTGSLVMAPCRYGVVDLYEDGSITYHTETVNVENGRERIPTRTRIWLISSITAKISCTRFPTNTRSAI